MTTKWWSAFCAGVVSGCSIYYAYQLKTQKKKMHPNGQVDGSKTWVENDQEQRNHSDEILNEQLSRLTTFFGEEAFGKIKNAFVIVVGVGGVGSHAAHLLARSGVSKIRLIDFDNVTLSSLNRHATATREDVGIPKVEALKMYLHKIVPTCAIEAMPRMFVGSDADELLQGNPTYILDCIDDATTKIDLLEAAMKLGVKVITSTSAGGKADPTRICIGNLADTTRDPLASKVRYYLRKRGVEAENITTVYSTEKPRCALLPLTEEQMQNPDEFGAVDNFRIRVMPVLGTMPALFGQSMAAYVLCDLAGKPLRPEAVARLSKNLRCTLFQKLQQYMRKLNGNRPTRLPLSSDDIDFIVQEIWQSKSAISGSKLDGGHERLLCYPWRTELPITPGNIVLITKNENDNLVANGIESLDAQIVNRIDRRLAEFGTWHE